MKGGVTRRIDEITKALDSKQLKRALYLSEAKGLEKQRQWIEEAARTCLANKSNKKACEEAIKMVRNKVQETVSLPLDDTSLEGIEEYLTLEKAPVTPALAQTAQAKSDDELFENCEECHVAVAAARIADICATNKEEAGQGCELIGKSLENEQTEPVDWLKSMIQAAEQAKGKAKEEMAGAITELVDYLEKRNSPFLEALDKESGDGKVS
jgi:hypothetical protein